MDQTHSQDKMDMKPEQDLASVFVNTRSGVVMLFMFIWSLGWFSSLIKSLWLLALLAPV